jgi:hypothetical protein
MATLPSVRSTQGSVSISPAQVTGTELGPVPGVNMLELVHAGADVTVRPPGPVGEAVPGGQGIRMLGAGHPLLDGQQRGVLVPGPGSIPASPVQ